VRVWSEIRRAGFITGCALVVTCACALVSARQGSASNSATKKPATTTTTAVANSTSPLKPASATKSKTHTGKRSRKKRVRGQQKIDSERAEAIQEALIREHYLKGEATGTWNQASEEAMRRYQADHGWQSKTVPDSRALIKLGLGPSKDHLLNPESAMTTVPDAPRAEPVPTTSQNGSPTTSHTAPPTSNPATAPSSNQSDPSRPQ
jgi:putative peptidoglycan binding protein